MYARSSTKPLLAMSLLLFGLVPACSSNTGPTDPESESLPGRILGLVTGDGAPVSGITITLSRGGSEVATVTTTGNGEFGFAGLNAGTYLVAISEIPGMNCSRQLTATVVEGEETVVSFACVSPPSPAPMGMVEGRVTLNGVGVGGVRVYLYDTTRDIGFGEFTANDGTYRFTEVSAGSNKLLITTEALCPGTEQENDRGRALAVTVPVGGIAVADFACTGQVITGSVTLNGSQPLWGWKVLVCYGEPVWDYGCVVPWQWTDSEGRYLYTSLHGSVTPGEYVVLVEVPADVDTVTCPVRSGVSVSSGESVTVDLDCVDPTVPDPFCNPNWDYCD